MLSQAVKDEGYRVAFHTGAYETLVTVHGSGEFTGEVNVLSGRRSLVRARATKPGFRLS
jgi:hypothetical protein